jgi:membrane associated rhomboid family serine protease
VWFDGQEYSALPQIQRQLSWSETLPQEAREKLALLEIEAIRNRAEHDAGSDAAPDAWWQWIPGVLGMPVEQNAGGMRALPWITWGVAVLITVVSAVAFFDLSTAIERFGLIPAAFGRYGGLTLLSSFLLHGGWMHLVGNVYFLLIFGDNVEDWLGRWRFLLLLVCATVMGGVAHILGDPNATTPCIGASGGISGVLTFYALRFPRVRLRLLLRLYFWFRWISLPAYVMLLVWVGMQGIGVWVQLSGFGHVSSLAHLGGAGVGMLFWLITKDE